MVVIFIILTVVISFSAGWVVRDFVGAPAPAPKRESSEMPQISATLYATANELYIAGAREAKYGRVLLSKNKFKQADDLIDRARKIEAENVSTPAVEAPYPTEQVEYVDASDSPRGYGV